MTDGSVLIIGSSRGIGAGLVREFLGHGWTVHGTVRDVASPGELSDLAGQVALHRLDVRDVDRTNALAAELGEAGLDVIIHNAGIYHGHSEEALHEVNELKARRNEVSELVNLLD